mmetsp:Transcript_17166/g.23717  ORF Transcript_17166/g.23717 Transcript_17166/m.23717 type:complete len:221 (-) Transcript_17166:211-873(-)|eukprot:CAMPEP_0196580230 /NCGR_PEP_ID=MMETSP1081-20130531/27933_1 /TAXON_ID=36882 /ORGANISM="Pyramimonas amylifera, Strain CCMP720" /LENGTH=220 /DNA_ID=CAMNT_0041900053 /DNA_START=86 /DNA_END=748 /DNA_ORIENTATION=-
MPDGKFTGRLVFNGASNSKCLDMSAPSTVGTVEYKIAEGLKFKASIPQKSINKFEFDQGTVSLLKPGTFTLNYNLKTKLYSGDVATKTTMHDNPLTFKLGYQQKAGGEGLVTLDSSYSFDKNNIIDVKYNFVSQTESVSLTATHKEGSMAFVQTYSHPSGKWSASSSKNHKGVGYKATYYSTNQGTVEINKKPIKITLSSPIQSDPKFKVSAQMEKSWDF